MKGYIQNIEDIAVKNNDFRQALYTARNCQLVIMAFKPKEEFGMEIHKLDQFYRVEEGTGESILDGVHTAISAGFAVLVPMGANHNIINTGSVPLKLLRSILLRIIGMALSTTPAPERRSIMSASTVKRQNCEPTGWIEMHHRANQKYFGAPLPQVD